jgi:sarcosine oxidase, subunit gamma
VRLDLQGPLLPMLFQRLANVPSLRLVEPTAIRTVIHHLGVFVVCRSSCISIYGPRSSADSLARSVKFAIYTINGLENKYEM